MKVMFFSLAGVVANRLRRYVQSPTKQYPAKRKCICLYGGRKLEEDVGELAFAGAS